MTQLAEVVSFLDREMRIARFHDSSNNGLQVANSGRVSRIACGVDASLEFFKRAVEYGADMVICHHGLSWGDSLKRITGLNYRRISFLMEHGIALYACHLPLDAHPIHGNNALICRALGLRNLRPFGEYNGVQIGFRGQLRAPMKYTDFKTRICRVVSPDLRTMDFGKHMVRTVGVVSGNGSDEVVEAGSAGLDVYLSGEASLSAYNAARDCGINAIFAGHYATERFGVEALSVLLARRFGVKSAFLDLAVPF